MKISILCPTRKRKDALEKSLNSLKERMSPDNQLELLLAFDNDDKESLDYAIEKFPEAVFISSPRKGYKNLNLYYNALGGVSTGDWLFVWNDDLLMETQNWDKIIEGYGDKFRILNPKNNHSWSDKISLFPIVPRKYYEILGHISFSPHNDTWVEEIGNLLNESLSEKVFIPIEGIYLIHNRFDLTGANKDETFLEREYQHKAFYSEEMVEARWVDFDKVKEAIS